MINIKTKFSEGSMIASMVFKSKIVVAHSITQGTGEDTHLDLDFTLSIVFISVENLFSILPTGVVSKNRIGTWQILPSMPWCIFLAAIRPANRRKAQAM